MNPSEPTPQQPDAEEATSPKQEPKKSPIRTSQEGHPSPSPAGKHRRLWQWTVLPLMAAILAGGTVFFLTVSMTQMNVVFDRLESREPLSIGPELESLEQSLPEEDQLDFARWKSLVLLDGYALVQRHEKGAALIMTRVWLKYLGFLTGMILALVGSAFVLGRLRDQGTEVDVRGSGEWKAFLKTTSPGIFLASLGFVLMMTTILIHRPIEVNDASVYVSQWYLQPLKPDALRPTDDQQRIAAQLGNAQLNPGEWEYDPDEDIWVRRAVHADSASTDTSELPAEGGSN